MSSAKKEESKQDPKQGDKIQKKPRPSDNDVNFPWFIYPSTPFSGYMDDAYLPELLRLTKFIVDMRSDSAECGVKEPTLFHLTIGSPMEEAGITAMRERKTLFQMNQIIPEHLVSTASLGVPVINVIVCPNQVSTPMFMELTESYAKVDDNRYRHKTLPITLLFFRTMMPTKNKDRNDFFMARFAERGFQDTFPEGVEMYRQTTKDRLFVDQFYGELDATIQHVSERKGASTCFSFAVFNDDTDNRRFNNFAMFREVLAVYRKRASLVCEWVFRYGIYVVYDASSSASHASVSGQVKGISFVPIEELYMIDSKASCWFMMPETEGGLSFRKVSASELLPAPYAHYSASSSARHSAHRSTSHTAHHSAHYSSRESGLSSRHSSEQQSWLSSMSRRLENLESDDSDNDSDYCDDKEPPTTRQLMTRLAMQHNIVLPGVDLDVHADYHTYRQTGGQSSQYRMSNEPVDVRAESPIDVTVQLPPVSKRKTLTQHTSEHAHCVCRCLDGRYKLGHGATHNGIMCLSQDMHLLTKTHRSNSKSCPNLDYVPAQVLDQVSDQVCCLRCCRFNRTTLSKRERSPTRDRRFDGSDKSDGAGGSGSSGGKTLPMSRSCV
ncbi:hypothetical protein YASMINEVIRUS_239 [Yasminevirus sp. GU-2018]|uniref:Uncharacterized protein n=1 Tax=Yasminevirus sp. GU-2018 TaxID=2420051 RepID=A0A5K0U9G7_9VIRU|nr:hypothetical protein YASMINEVIRUS_239 [Yasminevirus sp. GU-2018]